MLKYMDSLILLHIFTKNELRANPLMIPRQQELITEGVISGSRKEVFARTRLTEKCGINESDLCY